MRPSAMRSLGGQVRQKCSKLEQMRSNNEGFVEVGSRCYSSHIFSSETLNGRLDSRFISIPQRAFPDTSRHKSRARIRACLSKLHHSRGLHLDQTSNLTHPKAALPTFPSLLLPISHEQRKGNGPISVQSSLTPNRKALSAIAASVSPESRSVPRILATLRDGQTPDLRLGTPLAYPPSTS